MVPVLVVGVFARPAKVHLVRVRVLSREDCVHAIVLDPMLVHLLHVVRFHIFGPLGLPLPGVLDAFA